MAGFSWILALNFLMSRSSFEQTVTSEMKMVFMTPQPPQKINIKHSWHTIDSFSTYEPDLYRTYVSKVLLLFSFISLLLSYNKYYSN
jgi:hypothetical protein